MTVPGATKLRRAARCVRQRVSPGSLILLYHRVAERAFDPWSLCVTPAHFAEHLDVLRGRVRPLSQLARGARRRVAISFDDGYADVWHHAHPLLARCGAAATVFVATAGLDDGRPFWWDQLVALLEPSRALPTQLSLWVRDQRRSFELSPEGAAAGASATDGGFDAWPAARRNFHEQLYRLLGNLDAPERGEQLAALRQWAGSAAATAEDRGLTREEVAKLAAEGLVEVGAHTVSHPRLTALAPAEREREIRESQAVLADAIGRPVTSFAYPHGRHDETTRALLRASGFQRACTSEAGVVRGDCDRLQLPRVEVPDCDGEAFARLLARFGF